jgi:hypothetical protein
MAQTTWGNPAIAFAGLLADADKCYIRSHVNEEATAIPFGVGVVQGTLDSDAKLPAVSTDWRKFLGVTAHSHAYENQALAGTAGIAADAVANVVLRGPVYVQVESSVTPASPVYCRHAAGTGTQLGAFRSTSDGGTCFRLSGARFLTSAGAAGYAVLYVPGYRSGLADPEVFTDPALAETFDYGLDKGMAILQPTGAAYSATALAQNIMHFGSGHKIAMFPIVGQTTAPAMAAAGLDIQCDQVDNDGLELISHVLGLSGRPFIIGRDAAFYFEVTVNIADASGTDDFHVGFRRAETVNATFDNYLDLAAIGIVGNNNPAKIFISTILNNGATAETDTTHTLADGVDIKLRVNVSAAGVVTFLRNGAAPAVTAAYTFDDGDPVIPFLHMIQHGDLTEAVIVKQWEVGYQ